MDKVLGLDLGTNSIGWAIRDTSKLDNQIIDKGVLTFEKGVGEGKSGEFPLVQKRTESRSKRRNYQAEKYRKWDLLETLIGHKMVPLSIDELNEWRKYIKGTTRKYPQSEQFLEWLRFDFDGDGKPDFERLGYSRHENHYLFRMLATSDQQKHKKIFQDNPLILGRVLYHLVQRRGFRGRDEEEAKTIMQGSKDSGTIGVDEIKPYLDQYKTLGAALYYIDKDKATRIRKRYNLRADFEKELIEICRVQGLDEIFFKKLHKAIIWQRPLRSQKGLVGYCTFEAPVRNEQNKYIKAGKKRCPISHPFYEEYRTWVFINNLKIQLPTEIIREQYLQDTIYPIFYNKSKDFKLSSINKVLRKVGGQVKAKFFDDTKVISCTLLNAFENILGNNWKEQYSWYESLNDQPKNSPYSFEDIWHVLFTFDSSEKLKEFALRKLNLDENKAEEFSKIKIQQGYATLSLLAIKKLLPFLRQGIIYSEAVYLANMHKVLGQQKLSGQDVKNFMEIFSEIDTEQKDQILAATIINGLISDQLNSEQRWGMDKNYNLDHVDYKDIAKKIIDITGIESWNRKSDQERNGLTEKITTLYLDFLKKPINAKKDRLFIKVPRLHDKIFDKLQQDYALPKKNIKDLWHPSEQETYENAKEINGIRLLSDPKPISNGFKNPMALKTMYKLRHLVNYLLESKKIDDDTRIVIEIARELNDANKRKAIERWQREKERENQEYVKKMQEDCGIPINAIKKGMIDKYRLWLEQNRQCLYTGNFINCSELFSSDAKYDFEHTIPASMSFDSELKNLTIADGVYNKQIKGTRIPTQLANYEQDGAGYTAIKPRLNFMFEKVEHLENSLEEWKNKSKFASTKDIKDACIQHKHMIKFDLDYWRKKLDTFTCIEYKAGWRNSQLRDTQVVTKYALPYLKTVFNKVEVQKGSITNNFKEIYGVKFRNEVKSRDKHSHHAIDAAILTLIPTSAIRDKILLKYNEVKDNNYNGTYHEPVRQWPNFNPEHLLSFENNILINFQSQYRTLTATFKKVRKRGKQQFLNELVEGKKQLKLDEQGKKIPLIAEGDTIRGQLHKETFFAAIKQPVYEEQNGKFIPQTDGEGNFIFQENEKRKDELFFVAKVPVTSFKKQEDFDVIVDPNLKHFIKLEVQKRLSNGKSFAEAIEQLYAFDKEHDRNGNPILPMRHVRCKVKSGGGGFVNNPTVIKHNAASPSSKKEYKQDIYALNGETVICAFYQSVVNEEIIRIIEAYSIMEIAKTNARSLDEAVNSKIEVTIKKEKHLIPLYSVLKIKQKVLFYEEDQDELKAMTVEELSKRMYLITKFEDGRICFKYHLNSMSEDELKNKMKRLGLADVGTSSFNFDYSVPKLRLSKANFNFVIENKHFQMRPDGSITWLY